MEANEILLTDFTNTTGEAVLDDTLKQALAVQLGESPYLRVLPQQRVRETLLLMGRPDDERITEALGREICQREGIKAMIAGSIAAIGTTYAITLEASQCETGAALAAEQAEAGGEDEVLQALGQAASRLRGELGESLASVERLHTPIERATTPSLEALKAYSLGEKERARSEWFPAISLYKRALELDPSFALAHARIGTVYHNENEDALSREHYAKAYALRDRVTEYERLYITGHYYTWVTGEFQKAMETYELWKKTYPNHWMSFNSLGATYLALGRHDKVPAEAREAMRLEPASPLPVSIVAQAYIGLGRLDEARDALLRTVDRRVENEYTHTLLYWIACLEDDGAARARELDWARGKPEEHAMLSWNAAFLVVEGKLAEAGRVRHEAAELSRQHGLRQVAAGYLLDQALLEASFGKAIDRGETGAADRRRPLALALSGDFTSAEAELLELAAIHGPRDTLFHELESPEIRAAIALGRNDADAAIRLLESARPYENGYLRWTGFSWAALLRGRALLRAGRTEDAATELRKIVDRPMFAGSPVAPLARLELARATAAGGDLAESRLAYQDLLARWRDADAGLPVLEQARSELARLNPP